MVNFDQVDNDLQNLQKGLYSRADGEKLLELVRRIDSMLDEDLEGACPPLFQSGFLRLGAATYHLYGDTVDKDRLLWRLRMFFAKDADGYQTALEEIEDLIKAFDPELPPIEDTDDIDEEE